MKSGEFVMGSDELAAVEQARQDALQLEAEVTRRKSPAWANTFWTRYSQTLTRCSCTPGSTLYTLATIGFCPSFPYAVYYRVTGNVAQVWAVLDCRQDPDRVVRMITRR